ncbi:molybdate ABC transporter substrate-binding protein [Nocardioides marmoriginsengisoli]|uniref:molybdate ABC transporter substrate-binding protein n=1 Tax=Nocardioides marmoriginsengisoli TaxID=661483 RepID=UPI001609E128|nr:molybdate ABC transporter substrate-binding protein [Nocardioides marmoriginsengisoli]
MTTSRRAPFLAAVLAALVATTSLAACGSDDSGSTKEKTLTVFAAASLTGTFTELGKKFEADHPGVKVTFNFAGSSDLVSQITEGAPADVFASADTKNMDKLAAADLDGQEPENFASNTLEIVTPPGNPEKIATFADLARKGVDLVICAPEVPCGSAARTVASSAGVTLKPVSEEQSVKDVLAKVAAGEAEAGLVYVTDVKAAGDTVDGIVFPESSSAVNLYPITTVKDSKNADLAAAFVQLVLGSVGQGVLSAAGFARP